MELLAVVAMIGILAALAVVGYRKQMSSAGAAEVAAIIQGIRGAEETYRSEMLRYLGCSDRQYKSGGSTNMRAFKRYDRRGFTLVELMIVVAIIGVLAALAIYGVRRYLASAKTSEAKNTIGSISRGAAAAYERETAASELVGEGSVSTAANHALCASATTGVPVAVPAGTKYQPSTAEGTDFEDGNSTLGWKCLKFSMTQPIYYQYNYNAGGGYIATTNPAVPNANGFEAAAQGDLDGDATNSIFARTGQVNTATRQLIVSTQVYIENEYE